MPKVSGEISPSISSLQSVFHFFQRRRTATAACVAFLSIVCLQIAWAAIALSTSTAYTQSFDGMGIPATTATASTLPADFRVDAPSTVRTVGTFSAALATTARAGGANLSTSAANGIYNFGAGTTALGGSDRAVGFLSSGTATTSGNLYAQLANNTGASLTGLQISYNVEKYRHGLNPAGFRVQMFYSTDGIAWTTAGANFLSSFAADADNSGFATVPGASSAITSQTLAVTIPNGTNFYLAWNYSVTSGSTTTNAQALAVDDISILGIANTPTNPTATGAANPSSVQAGSATQLTVAVTPGLNPASTGITVTADLTSIGGAASQQFFDDGINGGDVTAGDNTFSFQATVPANTITGGKTLPVSVLDAQSRSASTSISLTVTPLSMPPTGTGSANPNTLQSGASTLLTVNVTGGASPASTNLAVSADLSTIGGSASQPFFDDGTNGDVIAGDHIFSFQATVTSGTTPGPKSLPATISDAQARSSAASISLTVQSPPAPNTIKISQVYGGGGNSGSTYTNDFIELYNQSTLAVDISTWSVQNTSAQGTTWNVTNLCPANGTCIVASGHYYLVQEAQGAGGTTALPPADATGTINMSSTAGKVALVANTTALTGACPIGGVADLVGYGGAGTNCSETTPTASLSNTSSAVRKGNGCVDTDNNSTDFVLIGPIPRNSVSPANSCGGDPTTPSGLGTASPASVDPAGITLLAVTVTPATSPASTGLSVIGDLTSIGGTASQPFFDDGTHGDPTPGDNVFSFRATVGAAIPTGAKSIPTTIADAQSRTAAAPITLTVQSPTCGVERWSVKTGTDADAGLVNLGSPIRTTVGALRAIPAPATIPLNNRVAPTETSVYVVNGTMTFYKLEDDVDYHIVLQDPSGDTMVTEIPSPACDGSTSPFDALVAGVRAKFDARLTAIPTFQNANLPVQIKGVGFFDFIHGQTGVAPNGIELHPVLDINFTTAGTAALNSSLNPSQFGQPVTFTATVTGGAVTPTGSVSFFDGAALLGTGTLGVTGQASFGTSALAIGPHSITASYEGDSQTAQSTSAPLAQTVNQATPVLTWPQPAPITFGGALGSSQLNATAAVAGAFAYTPPAGTVLPVGNAQTLSVTFTPSSGNYTSASKSVAIDVLPASGGGSPPNLIVTRTLARISGQVVATLTIANTGGTDAQGVTLTSAKIGTVSGTPLPQSLGTIAAGASLQTTITFPGAVGAPGAGSSLSLSGSYTGGTFSSSSRITLP